MRTRRKVATTTKVKLIGTGAVVASCWLIPNTYAANPDLVAPEVEVIGYRLFVGTSDAASQGEIGGELLDTRPILRPAEVLEYVPGLVVTQHSGDGKANQYFLRGYNLDHGTDLAGSVDGVPVNMPTNAHGQGYMDLNFLIPEMVDRIDYLKGPYYADYGDFSAAGAVDIYYRNSLDQNLVQLTDGSWNYKRMLFAGSKTLGAPGNGDVTGKPSVWGSATPTILGAAEYLHENGPWDPSEGLTRFNGLMRLSDGNRNQGWSLDGIFYKAHWDSTDQVPLPLIQSGQLGRFQALDPTDGGDSERAIVSGEWHSIDDQGYAKALVYAEHYNLQLFSDFTFFENRCGAAPNPNLPCDQFQQYENRNLMGTKLAKGWNHGLFDNKSTTEVGLQVRHDEIHVGLNNVQSRELFQAVRNDDVSETSTGIYVKNTTIWTPWFRTLTGMRADRVDMNVDAQLTPQNSGNAHAQAYSPKLSMIFGPWAKTEFFVNAGKGFHSNDARGVTQSIEPSDGSAATPVPALVSARGAEIGARTGAINNLQSSIAFWTLYSNSEVQYAADSDIGSTEPNGATRRYGVEWNNHWTPTHWLLFDLDLAWTHARNAYQNDNGDVGNQVPNAISKVASLGITVFEGTWSAGVATRYFGPYPLTQDGSQTAPSSITTNVRVQNQFTKHVSVALDVLNIFDRKNYDIVYGQDYQVSPTAVPDPNGITVHPAEPLQVRLTLRVEI
jgi:outer membrane receptor protein involved in Fe transport